MGVKIAIMGAGALGGYIGGRLAQAGRDVIFIARGQHLRVIQENGLHVQSPAGNFLVNPAVATGDPAEVGPVDLIFLCVKSYDVLNAAEGLQPMIQPETLLITVQNGIGHIEQIADVIGAEHVLGGVSLISGQITSPGTIQHNPGPDTLEFGEISGGSSARCEQIEQLLDVNGFNATVCLNILERMWWKLAAYSGVGVFCLARGDRGVIWATPEAKALYHQAIAEVVTVANARGIPLAVSVPDEHIAILDTFPPHWKPSMLVALEGGSPLELDAIQGAISAVGKEVGVPTPINDLVYACLKPYISGAPQWGNDS